MVVCSGVCGVVCAQVRNADLLCMQSRSMYLELSWMRGGSGRLRAAPQKFVVATKICGGHKNLWWHLAKKNSVYESESRYFLVASLISLTVGDNT